VGPVDVPNCPELNIVLVTGGAEKGRSGIRSPTIKR